MKYYISNNIQFIQGLGNLVSRPCSATHLTSKDAQHYISIHPDHCMMRIGKTKRNYVISTKQLFLGDDDKVVTEMGKARAFNSPCNAYIYLDSMQNGNKLFDEVLVIDENYRRYNRDVLKPQVERLTEDNVGRIKFTNYSKKVIVGRSNGICAICGKPLGDNVTIDHIIPISRGGTNDINNLRATHPICNRLKDSLLDDEMDVHISNVACNRLAISPFSGFGAMMIRGMVRNTISQYGVTKC